MLQGKLPIRAKGQLRRQKGVNKGGNSPFYGHFARFGGFLWCSAKNHLHTNEPRPTFRLAAPRSLTALSAFLDVSSLNLAALQSVAIFFGRARPPKPGPAPPSREETARVTLEQLRVFVAVAERRHVSQAGRARNLTRSSASAAIAALAARHGSHVFDRAGRGIALTEVRSMAGVPSGGDRSPIGP